MRRGCADQNGVEAHAGGRLEHGLFERRVIAWERLDPCALCELCRSRVQVDPERLAAGRQRDPRGELPDEPEADDADPLADGGLGAAHAVERDRADGGVGRVVEADPVRDRRDEVLRHGDDLGVVREPAAAARDAVAGRQTVDPGAELEDDPGRRVPEGCERVEPVAGRMQRLADSLRPRALDHLADEIGTSPRLLQEALAADLDLRPLGAGADQRAAVGDEQPPGPQGGEGGVDDGDPSVPRALGYLSHLIPDWRMPSIPAPVQPNEKRALEQ